MVSTFSQRSCFRRAGHESALALLRFDDAVARQQLDRLPDGDARDAELLRQLLVGGQPKALGPDAARDALPEDVGDLRVFRNVAVGDQIHRLALPLVHHDMTRAAPRSPIIRLVALVFADVICGMTDASITRSLFDAAHAQLRIEHRACVTAHPAGADGMKHRAAGVARETPETVVVACRLARHHLDVPEAAEGFLPIDLAQDLQPGDDRLAVDLFGKIIRRDARLLERIGRTDREPPARFARGIARPMR